MNLIRYGSFVTLPPWLRSRRRVKPISPSWQATNGTEYTATALPAPRQPHNTSDTAEAASIADTYRAGDPITVYHHPTNPQRSRLDPSAPNGLFWMSVLFGPLSILAGLSLAWWTFTEWRSKLHPK